LFSFAFPSEQKAEEVREKLLALQKEYLIELGDAVIAVRDDKCRVKLNQMMNLTAAGVLSGAFWGTLIGAIFLMSLVGTALGAASGALGGALSDSGINDDFKRRAISADPQDDHRQGAGGSRGRGRHGDAHFIRSHKRAGAA